MVPQVMDNQIKLIGKQRPERIIKVSRKTVGVSQYKPGAIRIAVPPKDNDSVVVHSNIMGGQRLRKHPLRR